MSEADHPTVRWFHDQTREPTIAEALDAGWLRQLCRDCGADDVGLVEIGRPSLDHQRADILRVFPAARTLVAFACRTNREPIRSPARSVANLEFHHASDEINGIARRVVAG